MYSIKIGWSNLPDKVSKSPRPYTFITIHIWMKELDIFICNYLTLMHIFYKPDQPILLNLKYLLIMCNRNKLVLEIIFNNNLLVYFSYI